MMPDTTIHAVVEPGGTIHRHTTSTTPGGAIRLFAYYVAAESGHHSEWHTWRAEGYRVAEFDLVERKATSLQVAA